MICLYINMTCIYMLQDSKMVLNIYITIFPHILNANIYIYIYTYVFFLGSGILSAIVFFHFFGGGAICAAQVFLTGDTPHCQVPGGFGAVGQPNDAWHQFHHCLVKSFAGAALQWNEQFDLRKDMYKLQKSVQGSNQTKFLGFVKLHLFSHCRYEHACGSTRLQGKVFHQQVYTDLKLFLAFAGCLFLSRVLLNRFILIWNVSSFFNVICYLMAWNVCN